MIAAECPACGENVRMGSRPKMGQRVVCQTCRTPLKVSWMSPLELDWADEEYEELDEEDEQWELRPGKKVRGR